MEERPVANCNVTTADGNFRVIIPVNKLIKRINIGYYATLVYSKPLNMVHNNFSQKQKNIHFILKALLRGSCLFA